MRDFSKAIVHLQALRGKFETLLDTARRRADGGGESSAGQTAGETERLRETTGFGTNPGNLRMLAYAPKKLSARAPLVVALHGCSQNAAEYDRGSGWSSLADRLGFAVLYPEQQPSNNPKNCFSWFLPGDTTRDQGEAFSIAQMIEHAITTFGSDRRAVFVTGLSAGGAMASTMLATYPEMFAGGAIIAGLPYGSARSVQQAFEAMFTEQTVDAATLGARVRAASPHRGPWPKISIWHGATDPIVKPSNADNIVRQWTDVHGVSATPSHEQAIGPHTRRVWTDANGETLIEAYSINGMAHGVPLATTGRERCGSVGAFFLDAGISSTYRIANFWQLGDSIAERQRALTMPAQPPQVSSSLGAVAVAEAAAHGGPHEQAVSLDEAAPRTKLPIDPNQVIAAAFKAAGLQVPENPARDSRSVQRIAPGSIIAAALKAAGLRNG